MRRERCPTCGRMMFVKVGVVAEVLHLAAMVLLLVALWFAVTHSAQVLAVIRGLGR